MRDICLNYVDKSNFINNKDKFVLNLTYLLMLSLIL